VRHLAAVLGAAALLAPTAAAADPVPYPATRNHDNVTFAGARLLWTDFNGPLRGQDPGGPERVVYVPKPVDADFAQVDQIAANATRIAFTSTALPEGGLCCADNVWWSLRAGPLNGPFALVAGREHRSVEPDLFDDIAVYDGGSATSRPPRSTSRAATSSGSRSSRRARSCGA
jgi:hypothetical protein